MQSGKLSPGQANRTLKFLLENMDAVSLSLKRRRTTWLGISAQFWWCGSGLLLMELVACTSAKKYIQVLEQQFKSQTMDFSGKALHNSTKKMLTHIFAASTTVWFYSRRVWPSAGLQFRPFTTEDIWSIMKMKNTTTKRPRTVEQLEKSNNLSPQFPNIYMAVSWLFKMCCFHHTQNEPFFKVSIFLV